jgi:hypothetical protein
MYKKSLIIYLLEMIKIMHFVLKNIHLYFYRSIKKRIVLKRNKKSILIANGPSLKRDITVLKDLINKDNYDLFCVNNFGISEAFFELKPSFYFFSDHLFWRDDLSEVFLNDRKLLFERILTVDWPLTILSLPNAKNMFSDVFGSNPCIRVIKINYLPLSLSFDSLYYFIFKFNIADIHNINSATTLFWILMREKYESISLFGVDFSSFKDIDSLSIKRESAHFYNNLKSEGDLYNKYLYNFPKPMSYRFFQIFLGFRTFDYLHYISSKSNIKVINYSSNSYVKNFNL